MNILFIGAESAGLHTFRLLENSNHTLKGILTDPDNGNKRMGAGIEGIAQKLGYTVKPAKLITDPHFASWIAENNIDVLLNVHSLQVICPEVIDATRVGAFNLHPGPLPQYAGMNAPSWAVYHQNTQHAVTLHRITDTIDAGEIIYEAAFPISDQDTGLTVSTKCIQLGLSLVEQFLEDLEQTPVNLPGRPQDLAERHYYNRGRIPGGGRIQWTDSARKIDAFVRACNYAPFTLPWGRPSTLLGDKKISIMKTEVSDKISNIAPGTVGTSINGKTSIATADNWILIERCEVDGDFLSVDTILEAGMTLR